MVYKDYFRLLSDFEKSQYKFNFCTGCQFYPCELIEEYLQFKKSHPSISKIPIVEAIAVSDDSELQNDTITVTARLLTEAEKNETVSASFSYDQENLKNGCIMSSGHVYQVECGNQRVTDGIGDHYKVELTYDKKIRKDTEDRWVPTQPIFISAQTGQGKNFFIENTLIPYVRELNYNNNTRLKVLILSNRLALKKQINNRLRGGIDFDDAGEQCYSYNDVADVMTYHGLLNKNNQMYFEKVQERRESRYLYVICDEAHFFTSDATFNPHTHKILASIVKLFKKSIRIYMSATPYDCLDYIKTYEERYKLQNKYQPMVFYHFKRNYTYLDVKTYSNFDELYTRIIESIHKRKEKWLIFIDDKEKGKTVKRKLEECGEKMGISLLPSDKKTEVEKILVVDAESKSNPQYQAMVLNETLPKGVFVLITTSVLDNGVNLTGIKNIVVSDMSKAKVLQMVGRARVNDSNDHKTVYLKRFDEKYVSKRLESLQNQQDAYHKYELAYGDLPHPSASRGYSEYQFLSKYYDGNVRDLENAKHWFGRSIKEPTKLYFNEIARSLMESQISQYKLISDEMQQEAKQGKVGQKYLEHQLSWFGKIYSEDDDLTFADKDKAKKQFVAFLEAYAESGEQIDQQKQKQSFCPEFTKLYDAAFGRKDPNKQRIYGIQKMNTYLEDENIGYEVISHSKYWIIAKCDRSEE